MAEEAKNQPQNEGKFWNVLWNYLKSDQTGGDNNNNSAQKSTRSKKKSNKVNYSPSMRQREPQLFDTAHTMHTVTLALWDNISGPRVEQLWTTVDVHRLRETKARDELNMNNINMNMNSSINTMSMNTNTTSNTNTVDPSVETSTNNTTLTSSGEVSADQSSDSPALVEKQIRLLELIDHVPRYALGGEVWASESDELTALTRVTARSAAHVTRPSSRKFAVVRSVKSQHVTQHSARELTGVTADVTDEAASDSRAGTALTPVTPPPAPQSTPLRRKIHLFSEIDTAVLSCVFRTHSVNESVGTDCALSLFFDSCHLATFNTWQHVLYDRLQELIHTHVTLIGSGALVDTALLILNADLRAILAYMDELFLAAELNRDHVPHISRSLLVDKTIDQDLLARAITSHLQTHGASIVVGSDAAHVTLWLETLALFTRREDRAKTAVNVSPVNMSPVTRRYVPDLLLQGIISNDPDQITDEHVIQSLTPATLIDLTRQQVKQTHLFHEYAVLRREWLRAKLDKALLIATNATQAPKLNNLWHARESLFVQVRVAAPLVVRLLKELFALPTRHLRAAHLHHYTTWLDKRAMLLIHYVSGLMARQPALTHLTDPALIKRIRTDLDLLHDVDYSLILARAEMISPGIYVTLTGDPGDIEEKIIRLFESF